MDLQILVLSKLIKDDGAFSLKKLINMGGAKVKGFDKTGLMEEFNYIHQEYVKKETRFCERPIYSSPRPFR
jgi:hypothetical protein